MFLSRCKAWGFQIGDLRFKIGDYKNYFSLLTSNFSPACRQAGF